eukprot:Skav216217  [mRNA]  locus=scaffold238:321341:324460:- [translate_table: standard]
MRKLPTCLYDILAVIFGALEDGAAWPQQWSVAKTVCLPKEDIPEHPFAIRPVTIMARLYRTWGGLRGKQAAQYLASLVPPEVGGPCKQVSADLVAALSSLKVELSQVNQQRLCGLVLDITKCYNAIPRGAMIYLLKHLGLPPSVVAPFQSMMQTMQRVFEVSGCCSHMCGTTTGLIEGCSFAVPSMLAIGILAYKLLVLELETCDCAFYADNWAVFASDSGDLKRALSTLTDFASAFRLDISASKSWLWATTNPLRTQLQGTTVKGQTIPVVLHANDLGFQQCYSKKKFTKGVAKRLSKAKGKLGIIKAAKVPRGCKKRLASAAGVACVAYGSVAQSINQQEHHSLRVQFAKAMQRTGTGSSSWLACNALEENLDPEFKIMVGMFQTWRRFARFFQGLMDDFHKTCLLLQKVTKLAHRPGPVAALVHAVRRLGVRFLPERHMILLEGVTLNWIRVPIKALIRLLQRAWIKHVCFKLQSRKDFRLDTFDLKGNARAFKTMTFLDQTHAMNYVIGRNITNDILSKFLPGVTKQCILCGQADSREHKAFHCHHTLQQCQNKAALKRIQTKWPRECWNYGLCPKVSTPCQLQKVWDAKASFCLPSQSDTKRFFFTDGTAFGAEDPNLCIAAAAFVESKWGQHRCVATSRMLVPGPQQNSFMGELFAILLVLNSAWYGHIFTDNQAVYDLLHTAIKMHSEGKTMFHDSGPIWDAIFSHISARPTGSVNVEKVKAHVEPSSVKTAKDKWLAWGNNRADKEAKLAVTEDNHILLAAIRKELSRVQLNREDLAFFLQYIADIAKLCLEKQQSVLRERRELNTLDITKLCFEGPRTSYTLEIPMTSRCILSFPYGSVYMWRLLWWARQLRWPRQGQGTTGDISFLELLMDFQIATNSLPPRSITDRAQRDKCGAFHYILDDHEIQADAKPRTLADISGVWKRSIHWLLSYYKGSFFRGQRIERVESLVAIGCSSWLGGLSVRPVLTQGNLAAERLHAFFVTGRGCNRSLGRVLQTTRGTIPQHPTEVDKPFEERLKYIRSAPDIFKDM